LERVGEIAKKKIPLTWAISIDIFESRPRRELPNPISTSWPPPIKFGIIIALQECLLHLCRDRDNT
jgi:hypothetical protein